MAPMLFIGPNTWIDLKIPYQVVTFISPPFFSLVQSPAAMTKFPVSSVACFYRGCFPLCGRV